MAPLTRVHISNKCIKIKIKGKELLTEEGTVLDVTVLHQLYLQRDHAEKKEAVKETHSQRISRPLSRKNKGKAMQPRKVSVRFEDLEGSSRAEASLDEPGYEMESWGSDLEAPLDSDSSVESDFMVATPLSMRPQAPSLSQTPLRPRHLSPLVVGQSVGTPVHRVTRSRAARSWLRELLHLSVMMHYQVKYGMSRGREGPI